MSNIPFPMNLTGYFPGVSFIQTKGKIGGARNVFVNLVNVLDDNAQPHIGGKVMNPPLYPSKMWAGDLLEYRTSGNPSDLNPEIYMLRTFKLADAVSNSTTAYIERDEFRHEPFAGDCLMVAPDVIGGSGTAVKVVSAVKDVASIGSASVNVWVLTLSAAITAVKGAIMVESEPIDSGATSAVKNMLVKKINGVFQCDVDFVVGKESASGVGRTTDSNGNVTTVTEDDFYKARYQWTPVLGGMMWITKMSPLPQCVLDLNMSNLDGVYHVNYALNGKTAGKTAGKAANDASVAEYYKSGATDPDTSTVGVAGTIYINTTDQGIFLCVGASDLGFTWKELNVS